jgi:hypothetical protein
MLAAMWDSKTYWRERSRKRRQDPVYREYERKRKLRRYYAKKDTPEYKAKQAARARRFARDPARRMKYEARWQAKYALKTGRIVKRPCNHCGSDKSEMHHPDYYKPLEIEWLCRPCHHQTHKTTKGNETWNTTYTRTGLALPRIMVARWFGITGLDFIAI